MIAQKNNLLPIYCLILTNWRLEEDFDIFVSYFEDGATDFANAVYHYLTEEGYNSETPGVSLVSHGSSRHILH